VNTAPWCCLLILFSLAGQVKAGWESLEPHPHQGLLMPYLIEPPKVQLSDAQQSLLEAGQTVLMRQKVTDGQRGVSIFRVTASVDTIWATIKNFRAYPQWIEEIDDIEIYFNFGNSTKVRFTAGGLFSNTVWYVDHDYPADGRAWGSWRLDYRFRSDIDDSVGYWRVLPVPGQPGISEVTYSADLKLRGFIASLFENSLIENSLKSASVWVKCESEAATAAGQ